MHTLVAQGDAVLHGLRQSEWIEASGVPRSIAFQLFRIAQITPEMRRPPQGGKPVAYLLPEHLDLLEPLAERYRQGIPLRQLEDEFQTVRNGAASSGIVPVSPEPSEIVPAGSEPSEIVPAGSEPSEIVPVDSEPCWIKPLTEALRPAADPLVIARRLDEAARLAVPLSQSEVAQLLGLSLKTIRGWNESMVLRPGIRLERSSDGVRVWWTVVRDGAKPSLTVLDRSEPSQTRIGFRMDDLPAAQGQEVTLVVRGPILPVIC